MALATPPRRSIFPAYESIHRFSVADYHKLLKIGVLEHEEAIELLDGYVVKKWDHNPSPLRPLPIPEWSALRRFTVLEYHAMLEHGILNSGDPVELIDGFMVIPMARNPRHDATIDLFREAMNGLLPSNMMLRSQEGISLLESEPEPDFAIVIGNARSFGNRHPRSGEIVLVVEVADSSLSTDRNLKSAMYARNGIKEYWSINISDGQIEVYSAPQPTLLPPAYESKIVYLADQVVPFTLEGKLVKLIPVSDLLP